MRVLMPLVLLLAPLALAASPPPAHVAKYRHTVMEAIGEHFGALMMIMKGESDRRQDAVAHAKAIADMAHMAEGLFPAGSGPGPGIETDAKAEIWTDKEKFATAMKRFTTEADKLVTVAATNDVAAFNTQLKALGEACGNCHDSFRVKKEK
jgi:cytochrome c556